MGFGRDTNLEIGKRVAGVLFAHRTTHGTIMDPYWTPTPTQRDLGDLLVKNVVSAVFNELIDFGLLEVCDGCGGKGETGGHTGPDPEPPEQCQACFGRGVQKPRQGSEPKEK